MHYRVVIGVSARLFEGQINALAEQGYRIVATHSAPKPASLGGNSGDPMHLIAVLELAAK